MLPIKTKKSDIHGMLNQQRRLTGLVFLTASVLTVSLWLVVIPDIITVYSDIELALPWFLIYRNYLLGAASIVFGIRGIYLLRSTPDYSKVDALSADLAQDELIDTKKLITARPEISACFLTIGWLALLITTIVLPLIHASKEESLQIQIQIENINNILDSDS